MTPMDAAKLASKLISAAENDRDFWKAEAERLADLVAKFQRGEESTLRKGGYFASKQANT